MTWGRTAIALVACLWILNAVVMLLGMGGSAGQACCWGVVVLLLLLGSA